MKSLLAIVCSLLFAWTQVVPASSALSANAQCAPVRSCCHCSTGSCCAPLPSAPAQPVSATPISSDSQNELCSLTPASALWILPVLASVELRSPFSSPLTTVSAPLYARNCALLI